jgi:hypothetical protein
MFESPSDVGAIFSPFPSFFLFFFFFLHSIVLLYCYETFSDLTCECKDITRQCYYCIFNHSPL